MVGEEKQTNKQKHKIVGEEEEEEEEEEDKYKQTNKQTKT